MNETFLSCGIRLPLHYPVEDVLSFHGRDAEQISEQTASTSLRKGIHWRGLPAVIEIKFSQKSAQVRLHLDGKTILQDQEALRATGRHMLGLDQPVEQFEHDYASHPIIGPLVSAHVGLRIPQTTSPFEALCWAIIAQMISVQVVVVIRRRMIQAVGVRHSSGLYCFPLPCQVAELGTVGLRSIGFSGTKAQSMLHLCEAVQSGAMPEDFWMRDLLTNTIGAEEITERLHAVKGIGPWTISYALLRGYGYLDGSLHGDIAVRKNLTLLLGREERVSEKETKIWLEQFSPWRALVAYYLWSMSKTDGY